MPRRQTSTATQRRTVPRRALLSAASDGDRALSARPDTAPRRPSTQGNSRIRQERLLEQLMDDIDDARRDGETGDLARLLRQARELQDAIRGLAGEGDGRPQHMSEEELDETIARLEYILGTDTKFGAVQIYCQQNGLELRRVGTGEVVWTPDGEE